MPRKAQFDTPEQELQASQLFGKERQAYLRRLARERRQVKKTEDVKPSLLDIPKADDAKATPAPASPAKDAPTTPPSIYQQLLEAANEQSPFSPITIGEDSIQASPNLSPEKVGSQALPIELATELEGLRFTPRKPALGQTPPTVLGDSPTPEASTDSYTPEPSTTQVHREQLLKALQEFSSIYCQDDSCVSKSAPKGTLFTLQAATRQWAHAQAITRGEIVIGTVELLESDPLKYVDPRDDRGLGPKESIDFSRLWSTHYARENYGRLTIMDEHLPEGTSVPNAHFTRTHDVDSVFMHHRDLSEFQTGLSLNYQLSYGYIMTQNARVTFQDQVLHQTKHILFANVPYSYGLKVYIFFPHASAQPVGMTSKQHTCWVNEILLPAIRAISVPGTFPDHANSALDAKIRSRARIEVAPKAMNPTSQIYYHVHHRYLSPLWMEITHRLTDLEAPHPLAGFVKPFLITTGHGLKHFIQGSSTAEVKDEFERWLTPIFGPRSHWRPSFYEENWLDLGQTTNPLQLGVTLLHRTACLNHRCRVFDDPTSSAKHTAEERYHWMLTEDAGSATITLSPANPLYQAGLAYMKTYMNYKHTHSVSIRNQNPFEHKTLEGLFYTQDQQKALHRMGRMGDPLERERSAARILAATKNRILHGTSDNQASFGTRNEARVTFRCLFDMPDNTCALADDIPTDKDTPRHEFFHLSTATVHAFHRAQLNRFLRPIEHTAHHDSTNKYPVNSIELHWRLSGSHVLLGLLPYLYTGAVTWKNMLWKDRYWQLVSRKVSKAQRETTLAWRRDREADLRNPYQQRGLNLKEMFQEYGTAYLDDAFFQFPITGVVIRPVYWLRFPLGQSQLLRQAKLGHLVLNTKQISRALSHDRQYYHLAIIAREAQTQIFDFDSPSQTLDFLLLVRPIVQTWVRFLFQWLLDYQQNGQHLLAFRREDASLRRRFLQGELALTSHLAAYLTQRTRANLTATRHSKLSRSCDWQGRLRSLFDTTEPKAPIFAWDRCTFREQVRETVVMLQAYGFPDEQLEALREWCGHLAREWIWCFPTFDRSQLLGKGRNKSQTHLHGESNDLVKWQAPRWTCPDHQGVPASRNDTVRQCIQLYTCVTLIDRFRRQGMVSFDCPWSDWTRVFDSYKEAPLLQLLHGRFSQRKQPNPPWWDQHLYLDDPVFTIDMSAAVLAPPEREFQSVMKAFERDQADAEFNSDSDDTVDRPAFHEETSTELDTELDTEPETRSEANSDASWDDESGTET